MKFYEWGKGISSLHSSGWEGEIQWNIGRKWADNIRKHVYGKMRASQLPPQYGNLSSSQGRQSKQEHWAALPSYSIGRALTVSPILYCTWQGRQRRTPGFIWTTSTKLPATYILPFPCILYHVQNYMSDTAISICNVQVLTLLWQACCLGSPYCGRC